MEYRTLGDTGVQVSAFCLGAMMLGQWGTPDHGECVGMVHRALDAGVNFIDTADRYSLGESEEILAKALKGRRDEVVLATKFGNPMGQDVNLRGGSRRYIVHAVEQSLRRLGTDHIDLYLHHRPDPRTDLDETLGALSDLVHEGKIRMIGTSNLPPEQIVEAHWLSTDRGHERIRVEQPPYSLFVRHIENAVLPTCRRYGMGTMVYAPLNNGWLTGKYRREDAPPQDGRLVRIGGWDPERGGQQSKFELVDAVAAVAAEAGIPLVHLAHAFALEHPAVTSVIIGPRTPAQLESALDGADVRLGSDVLDRLDELVPPGSVVDRADVTAAPPGLELAARRRGVAVQPDVFEPPTGDWRRPGGR